MKNELSSLYEKILLNEAAKSDLESPSNDTVGSVKSKQDLFGQKPKVVEGPDKAKVAQVKHDVSVGSTSKPDAKASFKGTKPATEPKAKDAEEVEEDEVAPKSKEEKKEQKNESVVSAFEALFKKTITEDTNEEETILDDTEVSEVEDSLEGSEETDEVEEEADLLSDLKELQDKLASILSKLEDVAEEELSDEEEVNDEYSDEDFEDEFGNEESEEETEVKESVEKPKALSDKHGKKLISKKNKVGKLNPKGGKAHTGTVDDEPEPRVLGDKKAHLQKGRPEPKSTVKKGDFIK